MDYNIKKIAIAKSAGDVRAKPWKRVIAGLVIFAAFAIGLAVRAGLSALVQATVGR
jgi:hypothetical protein